MRKFGSKDDIECNNLLNFVSFKIIIIKCKLGWKVSYIYGLGGGGFCIE